MLAKLIDIVSSFFLKLLFRSFSRVKDPRFGNLVCLKMLCYQKIWGVNRRVIWPCHRTSTVKMPAKVVHNGSCPGFNPGCYIDGRNGIEIGSSVWIGPNVSLISMNHSYPDYENYVLEDPIIIGERVWIGAGVIILPGVKIVDGAVIGAGSVVTKTSGTDLYQGVFAGNPAKLIRKID